ncbi:MAG: excinuclease ABC subunit UvrC [Cyclobacteriaceae bacterium]
MEARLREIISGLPGEPGIYRYLDKDNKLIYVGKARDLKKRVSSYFTGQSGHNRKTLKLIEEIRDIEYTITPTEYDALLLENTFIKQYQPKYNILLKDDKTFPYLCILNERFPRVISTRKYLPSAGEYFGPYTNVASMQSVLELVRRLYTIRTCSLALSPENIAAEKFKVCLEFHIGNCKAPCVGLIDEAAYLEEIKQVRKIIKGDLSEVRNYFVEEILSHSEKMEFEKASIIKRKLDLLDKFRIKNTVVNKSITELDIITIGSNEKSAWVNLMQVKEGAVVYSRNKEILKRLDESDESILSTAYVLLRKEAPFLNKEVLSNFQFEIDPEITLIIPKIGDKKKLVDLSLTNAETIKEKKESNSKLKKEDLTLLVTAKNDLRLKSIPRVIECFDNSNLQGTTPVASMVQFSNGKPRKSEYRHFNIKSVEGPDDFASMNEIVGRRYKRILEEGKQLPDLIIVDGGKGQLSSACEALKALNIYGSVPIIGIAKNLEEIFFPEDSLPLLLGKRSPTLRLIQQLRNEAHRFGITFHRKKRGKKLIDEGIVKVPGVSRETIELLLREFKSFKKILAAGEDKIAVIVGVAKARKIIQAAARSGE